MYQGIFIQRKISFPGKAMDSDDFCLEVHWYFRTFGIEQVNQWNEKRLTLIHARLVKYFSFLKCFSVPLI